MNITIEGKLCVIIGCDTLHQITLTITSSFAVDYNYFPQTNVVRLRCLDQPMPTRLHFHFPARYELRRLIVFDSKVVVENNTSQKLAVEIHGPRANVILRGNNLTSLKVDSFARNVVDMSLQSMPDHFSHRVTKGTQLKMPNQGPPTCVVCCENEITQVFTGCGHWCLCKACATITRCPICRQESTQMRVLQAAAQYC
jgi:hypothetical protein